jgi:hypothetical protein
VDLPRGIPAVAIEEKAGGMGEVEAAVVGLPALVLLRLAPAVELLCSALRLVVELLRGRLW